MDNIVLIGFMGSGKTSVAKKLAEVSAYNMVDTDKLIEEKYGKISDLFSEKGEEFFRTVESDVLCKLLQVKSTVISTGGGIILKDENREILKKIGKVVYLKTSPETVVKRLKNDKSRPLLQGDDKLKKVKSILDVRESLYLECADTVVDTDSLSKQEIVERILS